jgi:hypothetical protein
MTPWLQTAKVIIVNQIVKRCTQLPLCRGRAWNIIAISKEDRQCSPFAGEQLGKSKASIASTKISNTESEKVRAPGQGQPPENMHQRNYLQSYRMLNIA